ncbi:MAG: arsenical pump rane protein [Streptosporangiaceae bacterium]|nr:arsenical pump rane protein [Streptosporangiaceae bacterium]
MHGPAAEALSCVLLAAVLATAITRPRWLPEAAIAVPAAVLVIVTGALPWHQARTEAGRLLPVLAFLGAILVVGYVCQQEGLFAAAGARLARASRGSPVRLLGGVFGLASVTTAVLSLDTTVVLLTPVVHDTATRLRVRPKPPVYACTHLANSASLLLPVSNLTNLLAFSVAGLTLIHFGALMAAPWLVAIAVEYAAFRWFFAGELAAAGPPAARAADAPLPRVPRFALITVLATLAGFVLTSLTGLNPAWAAGAGAMVLAARSLIRGHDPPAGLARALGIPFLLFVLGLGIVVEAVVHNGLGAVLARLIPAGSSLPSLLALAGLAALLANVVNNLPAVLVLLSVLAGRGLPGGPGPVLAALIGVDVGPNLSYAGSLATLLWRRLLADRGQPTDLGEFTRLGLLTVPAGLVLVTVTLWAVLQI